MNNFMKRNRKSKTTWGKALARFFGFGRAGKRMSRTVASKATLKDVINSFNGERWKTADEIAVSLGRIPGKEWQRKLAKALGSVRSLTPGKDTIKPRQVRVNGKRVMAYDRNDFVTSQDQKDEIDYRRAKNLARLGSKGVLAELDRLADSLEENCPKLPDRWRRLRAGITIERRKAERIDKLLDED